jgi:hypothetical protein
MSPRGDKLEQIQRLRHLVAVVEKDTVEYRSSLAKS